MQLSIGLWVKRVVESSGGEVILSLVKRGGVEDLTSLLSERLTQVMVVLGDAWSVASIARNDSGLLFNRRLRR